MSKSQNEKRKEVTLLLFFTQRLHSVTIILFRQAVEFYAERGDDSETTDDSDDTDIDEDE